MARDGSRDDQERARWLRAGLVLSGLSLRELEFACLGLGISMDRVELTWALAGGMPLLDYQYDVIAQGINDRLIELGLDHFVPSAAQLRSGER